METIAVIDFETTGLGPTSGGRATEIAAVLVRGGVGRGCLGQPDEQRRLGAALHPGLDRHQQ